MPNPYPDRERDLPPLPTRTLRNLVGGAVLIGGLASLFLPILQALMMVVVGLLLIDLPIKTRAHRRLRRIGWYDRLARTGESWTARWRGDRRRDSA
ncbi:MAG: hypothetical protein IPK26_21670 [Planctomycetes bacterium]|nr:hypothetical protein [Planctomycetota bacterium]